MLGIAYENIMLNFNNTLTSKIISLIIAVSFFMTDISYAGAYQQGFLRVPMGRRVTYDRMGRVAEEKGDAPAATAPNFQLVTPLEVAQGRQADVKTNVIKAAEKATALY